MNMMDIVEMNVLVVDEDFANLKPTQQALANIGFVMGKMEGVETVFEAQRAMRNRRIDLIIIGSCSPTGSWIDIILCARDMFVHNVEIILATDEDHSKFEEARRKLGPLSLIPNPPGYASLKDVLEKRGLFRHAVA